MTAWFERIAQRASIELGKAWSFIVATWLIIVWAVSGPLFHFSDTWQLVINTGTTVATFLMIFLLQNTQNRDTAATEIKLNALLLAIPQASNYYVSLQEMTFEELQQLIDAQSQHCHDAPS